MRFKGVLFDAGEVLVHRDLRLLQRLAALVTGQRFVEDSVRLADRVAYNARLQEINAGGYDASWSSSQARLAFVAERMILELYPDARPSQVSDFQTRFYHLHMEGKIYGRTASDVRAALERLQSAGMIRTVLSNADGNLNRVLQHCEILDLFDGTIDSHQIGLSKPHPDSYRMALQAMSLRPQDVVFFDDNARYLQGAQELGIHPVQFIYDPENTPRDERFPLVRTLTEAADYCLRSHD